MTESKTLLEFKHVKKTFKNDSVIENFNLKIKENEIIALLGKSGCGKSTIIKILLGLYRADQGELSYQGKNLLRHTKLLTKIIGYVSQDNSFYEKLTVEENLRFFGRLYNVKSRDLEYRMDHLLHLVKLESARDTIADRLSGGMKRRLEFAISLIHNPHLLILDEPFAGLDIEIRDELWKVLEKIRDSHVTVIIITHLLTSVQKHCNRAVILHKKNIKKEVDLFSSKIDLEAEFKKVVSM